MLNHEYLRRSNLHGSDLAWIEEKFRVRDWLVYSPTRSVFLRAFPILKFFQQPEKNKNQFVAPGAGAPSLPTAQKRSAYGNFSLRKNLESGHVGRGERERHGSPDSINSLLASEWRAPLPPEDPSRIFRSRWPDSSTCRFRQYPRETSQKYTGLSTARNEIRAVRAFQILKLENSESEPSECHKSDAGCETAALRADETANDVSIGGVFNEIVSNGSVFTSQRQRLDTLLVLHRGGIKSAKVQDTRPIIAGMLSLNNFPFYIFLHKYLFRSRFKCTCTSFIKLLNYKRYLLSCA